MKSVHGLSALKNRRLKISRIHELNDPFEFLGVDCSEKNFRRALTKTKAQLSRNHGILCFSSSWRNPALWAHYAENHRGMCLGFDMPESFLQKVKYVNRRLPKPDILDEAFVKKLLFTKFEHWAYEDEYRAYVRLEESIGGLYYAEFGTDLQLREAIVGDKSAVTRTQIRKALGRRSAHVKTIKARPAFRSFEMVKQHRASSWA